MALPLVPTAAASKVAIDALERRYGPMPQDYLRFLSIFDGTIPPCNVLESNDRVWVRYFIPAADIATEADSIIGIPRNLMPISVDDIGNYICIESYSHKIALWDHESTDVLHVADNFQQFMDGLRVNDQPVQLPKGVIVRRLDPTFRPEFD